jgi:hypothetical protein
VPEVTWLGGGTTGSDGVTGDTNPTTGGPLPANASSRTTYTTFVPRTTNQLNTNTVSGSPTLLPNNPNGSGSNGDFLGTALAGAGIGAALCTAGLLGGVSGGAVGAGATAVAAGRGVPVFDGGVNAQTAFGNTLKSSDTFRENFLNCITRTIARAAIQQITTSVVNWINSGFNGQPSFVTNYRQFFTNVADRAAGEFIRGSGLSFLCSPFQNQIRIALAQSYARRNEAPSCSLSKIVGNQQSFMNGNFKAGGWAGLLSYTTVPTNNAFGADSYARNQLIQVQQSARGDASLLISPGGFLSKTECNPPDSKNPKDCKIVTPGRTIESALEGTLQTSLRSLELAKNFDEIISALITQLMTKVLYSGLKGAAGNQGYAANYLTPEQQGALSSAQGLLTDMQSRVITGQQYGQLQQGNVNDLQNTVKNLQDLVTCWETASSSESVSAENRVKAAGFATSTLAVERQYEARLDAYNLNIAKANQGIALLQDFQTRTLAITSASQVSAISTEYQQAIAVGGIVTPTDVEIAQQDRTSLLSNLGARDGKTSAELTQCHAF